MPSIRPWENWCGEPQSGQEGENQTQGRYPKVLIKGNKRRGSAALKSLFPKETVVGIWPSGREKGRKEGRRQNWGQLWIWL